jgi:hypothetical protein
MAREDVPYFLIGVAFTLLGLWQTRKICRALRRLDEGRKRSLEVSGTVVKVDYAIESQRFQPTFAYRTFSGENITARSLLLFDRNDKADLPYGAVGGSVRLRYDPQDVEWVIPGVLDDKGMRQMRRKGVFTPGVFFFFGVLGLITPLLPD